MVMGDSGGYRRLTGGSDDFSLQTDTHTLHHNIYITIIITSFDIIIIITIITIFDIITSSTIKYSLQGGPRALPPVVLNVDPESRQEAVSALDPVGAWS